MAADMVSKTATKAAKRLAKAGSLPNRASVTFLAGDGDYWKGVLGLVKGLRKAKSANPLVVALLPDVPQDHRNKLINQGRIAREIEPVASPPEGRDKFAWAYYAINYSKLRMWEMATYAVMDCFCEMCLEPCADKVKWPKRLGPEPKYYFNAGVFVFEPSFPTYADLLKTLEVTPPTAFADQHPEGIDLDSVKDC